MRKLLITLIGLCLVNSAFGVGFYKTITCPATLTCNYSTGVCNLPSPNWTLVTSGNEPFSGNKTIPLSNIQASKDVNLYYFNCQYNYENDEAEIYQMVNKLYGNWSYSGFGKTQAVCTTPTNPSSCQGTIISS
jgi:hypothetical protein